MLSLKELSAKSSLYNIDEQNIKNLLKILNISKIYSQLKNRVYKAFCFKVCETPKAVKKVIFIRKLYKNYL